MIPNTSPCVVYMNGQLGMWVNMRLTIAIFGVQIKEYDYIVYIEVLASTSCDFMQHVDSNMHIDIFCFSL